MSEPMGEYGLPLREERFDWERVAPGPLAALTQAVADRVDGDGWCSNETGMEVLEQLWDAGYRLVRHPWFDRDPLLPDDAELMARYRAALAPTVAAEGDES